MSPEEILKLPMEQNDAQAKTVRGFLVELIAGLWREKEGFSGKRPFGNGGWELDLYATLIKHGVVDGKIDEDNFVDTVDDKAADTVIAEAIQFLKEEEYAEV